LLASPGAPGCTIAGPDPAPPERQPARRTSRRHERLEMRRMVKVVRTLSAEEETEREETEREETEAIEATDF
jgi:hypothetical protein